MSGVSPQEVGVGVKFIAEVSSNHSRDLKRCLEFIDADSASNSSFDICLLRHLS